MTGTVVALASDLALLRPHLEPVTLDLLMKLEESHKRINDAYFLDSGIATRP